MKKTLPVSVVLGNPRVDCSRLGICRLEGSDEERPSWSLHLPPQKNHRLVRAFLSITEEGALALFFPTENMMPLTKKMFFGKQNFIIEVNKALPNALCIALGQKQGTAFLSGKWPITISDEGYTIAVEAVNELEFALENEPNLCHA